jgi:2-oxoglutarate ferredoxin oxidoreductase subunit alpha
MTPVYLLSDGYLANGAEPWLLPDVESIPPIEAEFRTDPEGYFPYLRDPETLSRPWVIPGTPGMEHRIGGIESEYKTGNISYAPANHEQMVRLRARKIAGVAAEIPPSVIDGPAKGRLLILGWGSTYGSICAAVAQLSERHAGISHLHLRHLNPLPPDLGDILGRFEKILIPEMNLGQLSRLIRAEYLVDAIAWGKVQGSPFKVAEIVHRVETLLED